MSRIPRPAALALTLAVAAVAAATRMVPYEYRPLNFAAVGAVALFAGGRLGFLPAALAVFAAMGVSDLYLYFTMDYSPAWPIYLCYLGYAALGRGLLRRTEHPARVGGVALAASLLFFLVSNFASWLEQSLPYPQTPGGLVECYAMAVPFYRGTLIGDLLFTGLLFGTHAVLVRTVAPRERVVPVTVGAGR